jgi:AraC-like DNA-binding protein
MTHNAKPPTRKIPLRDPNAARRVQDALKLRAQRKSWDEIAASCGYDSRGSAHHAVMKELQRCISEDVQVVRREELASLDAAEQEVWPLFLDRKNSYRLYALDRILAIKERRARYLGLDQTPDAALMAGVVVVREVPSGYLAPVEATKE